jgi:hypothetical protein
VNRRGYILIRVLRSAATKFGDLPENHQWNQRDFKDGIKKSIEWYREHILKGKKFLAMGTDLTVFEVSKKLKIFLVTLSLSDNKID